MKKMLLIGVAASSMMLATHAHADTALPNQMLGDWCYSKAQRGYVRQRCGDNSALVVRRDGFVTIDVKCRFDRVEPTANGVYLVRSTCTDGEEEDDRGPPYTGRTSTDRGGWTTRGTSSPWRAVRRTTGGSGASTPGR